MDNPPAANQLWKSVMQLLGNPNWMRERQGGFHGLEVEFCGCSEVHICKDVWGYDETVALFMGWGHFTQVIHITQSYDHVGNSVFRIQLFKVTPAITRRGPAFNLRCCCGVSGFSMRSWATFTHNGEQPCCSLMWNHKSFGNLETNGNWCIDW